MTELGYSLLVTKEKLEIRGHATKKKVEMGDMV